jgi:hypothetical protein
MVNAVGSTDLRLTEQEEDKRVALEKFKILKSVIKQLKELHSKWEKQVTGDQTKIDALKQLCSLVEKLLPNDIFEIRSWLKSLNSSDPSINQIDTITELSKSFLSSEHLHLLNAHEIKRIEDLAKLAEHYFVNNPQEGFLDSLQKKFEGFSMANKVGKNDDEKMNEEMAQFVDMALAAIFVIACNEMGGRRDTTVDNAFIEESIQIRELLLNILKNIDVEADAKEKLTGQISKKLGFLEELLKIRSSSGDSSLEMTS